jgi:hypothetical protein
MKQHTALQKCQQAERTFVQRRRAERFAKKRFLA